jgi:hypothetical protein
MIYFINETIKDITKTIKICNNANEVVIALNDKNFLKKIKGRITVDKEVI